MGTTMRAKLRDDVMAVVGLLVFLLRLGKKTPNVAWLSKWGDENEGVF